MKILLTHVFDRRNAGDAAIVATMITGLKNKLPGVNLTIFSLEKKETVKTFFEEVEVKESFFNIAVYKFSHYPLLRILRILGMLTTTLLWSLAYRYLGIQLDFIAKEYKNILHEYAKADLIIPVGGGYLLGKNNWHDTVALVLTTHDILVAKILNKKVVLYSQSIGPFGNSLQVGLIRYVLNKVDMMFIREGKSENLLRTIGMKSKIVRVADSAFLLPAELEKNSQQPGIQQFETELKKQEMLVGFTVRSFLDKQKQAQYEKNLAEFADYLITEVKIHPIFIPQVSAKDLLDDDRGVQRNIQQLMLHGDKALFLWDEFDYRSLKYIYAHLDYLITTRMHGAIFALTSFTPTIAISYLPKTDAVFYDPGLSEWVLPMAQLSFDQLKSKFSQLQLEKEKYVTHLEKVLPEYKIQAALPLEIIKKEFC